MSLTSPKESATALPAPRPVLVPIRSLGPSHRERIATHLLSLDPADRYLRFGYAANNNQIQHYVDALNFERDEIFGIYNRRLILIAVAHLAVVVQPAPGNTGTVAANPAKSASSAEFGVSVLPHARGRGYGGRLFDRAVMHARNSGVSLLFIHALSENTAMLKIARKAGARIERDGPDSEAYLQLPPADLDSRMSELLDEQIAQTDYRFKVQAKHLRDFLGGFREVRRGVQDSRDRMPM